MIKDMQTKLRGFLQSSTDPTGQTLAVKVQAAILALSSIIILIAGQVFHIQLSATDVISLAAEIGTAVGAIGIIFGSLRSLVIWWGTVNTQ